MDKRAQTAFKSDQSGLSLIEVIVALMVFGIVAIGVAYTLTNILTLTRDARSRVVAANLASQFVDEARSVEDIFQFVGLGDGDGTDPSDTPHTTKVVDGVTYSIFVEAKWVTDEDTTSQCGAAAATGNTALKYKRINVTVTWEGMREGTTLVRSDTVIAPNSRINEPTLGSIVIAVESELGDPRSGIASSTTPTAQAGNTAAAVPAQGLSTDADGCSYVLKVVPGTYDVKLTKTGYTDVYQASNTSSTATVTVVAGGTALARFTFDNGALLTSTYPASTPMIPTNLQTTFSTTFADKVMSGSNPVRVFPFAAGYQVIAGTVNENGACKSPDPAAWPVRTADGAIASRPDPVTISPGSAASVPVALGRISVSTGGLGGKYITAVLQTAAVAGGDPGCATPKDSASATLTAYRFGTAPGNSTIIGLPWGTYRLYYGNSAGALTTNLTGTPFKADGTASGLPATNIVTLDPRLVPVA